MNPGDTDLPRWVDVAVLPAFNLLLALAAAGIVVRLAGLDPFQVLPLVVKGAFGSRGGLSYTLYYATTFVFTGLAVAVALHAGLFNIGGEGQATLGGLGAALVALAWGHGLPAWATLPLMVASAMLFGLAWAAVPAALQAWVPALGRADRCVTCHMAVSYTGFETAEQPLRTHPREILKAHPASQFGCTACHGGMGWAVDAEPAQARSSTGRSPSSASTSARITRSPGTRAG